jgi:hypothetical protein
MHKKFQLLFIFMLLLSLFFSISPPIQASEQTPPEGAAAPAQISQEAVPGSGGAVAMDPNAKAVFPTASYEFDSVYEGIDVFHDFIIKNEGTADLKIINVKSG